MIVMVAVAGEGCEDDAMLQVHVTNFDGMEQTGNRFNATHGGQNLEPRQG